MPQEQFPIEELMKAIRDIGPPTPSVQWDHRTSPYLPEGDLVYVLNPDWPEPAKKLLVVSRHELTFDQQMMAVSMYLEKLEEPT